MHRLLAHRRAVAWLLVLGFALGTVLSATGVFAADEPPAKDAAAEEPAEPASASDMAVRTLEERLNANPETFLALLLLKFLPLGIGVLLLILWWLKRDKIRGGMLPPRPRVEATVPVPAGQAYGLAALGMYVIPFAAILILVAAVGVAPAETPKVTTVESAAPDDATAIAPSKGEPGASDGDVGPATATPQVEEVSPKAPAIPLWIKMLAMALGTLPIALLLLRRRAKVQAATVEERRVWFPKNTPEPTSPPPAGRAAGLGFWGYCVATVAVVPVSMLWILVLELSGIGANLQDLVRQVLDPGAGYEPWLIVFFGVVVAPFTEEILFRGTLYPATKRAFGGDRRAAWRAALLVSLLFAAVHPSLAAFLPLLTLALVLTWIMETTNSLMACIVAHAVHNAFSLVPLMLLRVAG